jgi:hypothetical protein
VGTNTITITSNLAGSLTVGVSGTYSFPLHNKQGCDIYSLGPHGLTRGATVPLPAVNGLFGSEWKPTHGGSLVKGGQVSVAPWNDPTSLDAWVQVWGTPGDGNDVNSPNGNVMTNPIYQDNICNW